MSLVEMNLNWMHLYKCFQTATHPPRSYLSSLPHKHAPSGVARILWGRLFLQGSQLWPGTEVWLLWGGTLFAEFSCRVGRLRRYASEVRYGATSISALWVRHMNTWEYTGAHASWDFLLPVCRSHLSQLGVTELTWHFCLLEKRQKRCWCQLLYPPAVHRGPSDVLDSYLCIKVPKLAVEE